MSKKKVSRKKATKSFLTGFKDFISKGNIVDMAVGVIIGGSFGKIVNSLVQDIIMPPIGLLIGNVDFKDLQWVLKDAVMVGTEVVNPAVTMNYGAFIMVIIEFLIIAFSIYFVLTLVIRRKEFVEALEKEAREKEEAEAKKAKEAEEKKKAETPSEEILLLREIRDSLNKNK